MKLLQDRSSLVLAAISALAVVGCSKSGATVRGVITIDGQPIPRGSVTFSPTGNTKGPVRGAVVQSGQYVCDDVPVGAHNVVFSAEAENYREFTDATGVLRRVPIDILPPQYASGVAAEVKPGMNQLDFQLSRKGK